MKVRLNLSHRIADQIDQGVNVVTKSRVAMPGTEPLIDDLEAKNTDLTAKHAAAIAARGAVAEANAALRASAGAQRNSFGDLGGHVNTVADGDDTFILSAGYEVRSTPAPLPPITVGPANVRARINGVVGQVTLIWQTLVGARNYEVQYSTDLSGLTGWVTVAETPGKGRLDVGGLTSGTKYAFRVRGYGNAQPGPWSDIVQQMAP